MKKVIISSRQLGLLNEADTTTIGVNAANDSLSDFSQAATSPTTNADIQKAKNTGDVDLVINGPNKSDEEPTQMINVADGDTVQSAIQKQGNDALIRKGGSMRITGDGFGESKVFTKKMVEEARLEKMKNEGRVMTKKQLRESFK